MHFNNRRIFVHVDSSAVPSCKYSQGTARYQEETVLKQKEYDRLEEKAQYSSSDKFYEDKARDEGYVREDEIVFIVGN